MWLQTRWKLIFSKKHPTGKPLEKILNLWHLCVKNPHDGHGRHLYLKILMNKNKYIGSNISTISLKTGISGLGLKRPDLDGLQLVVPLCQHEEDQFDWVRLAHRTPHMEGNGLGFFRTDPETTKTCSWYKTPWGGLTETLKQILVNISEPAQRTKQNPSFGYEQLIFSFLPFLL